MRRVATVRLVGSVLGSLLFAMSCGGDSKPVEDGGGAGSGPAGKAGKAGAGAGAVAGATSGGGAPATGGNAQEGGSVHEAGSTSGGGQMGDAGAGTSGECVSDGDCAVLDDCCRCAAVPKDDASDACDRACVQNECAARGVEGVEARCVSKRCVLDLSCDRSRVTCKVATPTCQAGEVPSVVGTCWGPCVPSSECAEVTGCDDCSSGEVCVQNQDSLFFTQCLEVSAACGANPTCACTDACSFQCSDADGVSCFCIAC